MLPSESTRSAAVTPTFVPKGYQIPLRRGLNLAKCHNKVVGYCLIIIVQDIKDDCGYNHKWQLASTLYLSSGVPKFNFHKSGLFFRLYKHTSSIARLDMLER